MNANMQPPPLTGIQGWKQFLTSKRRMLAEFDRAREQDTIHEVQTYRGTVAEAQFRDWLESFLPGRFTVTPGYIVSQGASDDTKLPHFDVIIFDQLESPVLWIEDHPDVSAEGASRAIPAEYVRGVLEVKSTFDTRTTSDAIEHLHDLDPLLIHVDDPAERYKKFLPSGFFSAVVFFDLRESEQRSKRALNNLVPDSEFRGYIGGLILRGEGLGMRNAGRIQLAQSHQQIESTIRPTLGSLLSGFAFSDFNEYAEEAFVGAMLSWNQVEFARFAFDLVAILNGTYDIRRVSSFHGLSWVADRDDSRE